MIAMFSFHKIVKKNNTKPKKKEKWTQYNTSCYRTILP